jgi:hypothetical protein
MPSTPTSRIAASLRVRFENVFKGAVEVRLLERASNIVSQRVPLAPDGDPEAAQARAAHR